MSAEDVLLLLYSDNNTRAKNMFVQALVYLTFFAWKGSCYMLSKCFVFINMPKRGKRRG